MFSKSLFKATIKQNFVVFIIILAVLTMYMTMITGMYDPEMQSTFDEMLKTLPKELISALGFTGMGSSLISFIATYFYGFLILFLPIIYTIIVSNRSISSHVDRGSMAYILATPNQRKKIAFTQATFLIISTSLLIAFITLIGITMGRVMFPGELDVEGFLLLNLGALILYFALTGIGFFASCYFNDSKHSLAIGAGLPVAFLVLQMISDVGEKTKFLKYITLYTLFNPENIVNRESFLLPFITLAVIGIIMYSAAIYVFDKRDLPL